METPPEVFSPLLDWLIDATFIGSLWILLILGVQRLWQGMAPARHHALWCSALLVLVIIIFAPLLPRKSLGVLPAVSALDWFNQQDLAERDFHELAFSSSEARPQVQGTPAQSNVSTYWEGWAGVAWLFGVLWLGFRLALDVWRLNGFCKSGEPVPFEEVATLFEKLGSNGPDGKRIAFVRTQHNLSPMVWGWRNPKVLLPKDFPKWTRERQELVMLHEWGHVVQRDYPYLMVSRVLSILFWFNPLVWIVGKNLAVAREHSCDKKVLEAGVKPSLYADHLLDLARTLRPLQLATLAAARPSELEGRLIAILDHSPQEVRNATPSSLTWTLCLLVTALPLIIFSPWRNASLALAHTPMPSEFGFSDSDWKELASHDITPTFVQQLVTFGFRDLTAEKVLYLKRSGVEAHHIKSETDLIFDSLARITDPSQVCMRANEVSANPNMAIEIEGKRYFALPRCALLMHRPGFRIAVDPVTGKQVDKANAIIGAASNGIVFYFESEASFQQFNRNKNP